MRMLAAWIVSLPLILMPGATLNPEPTPFPTATPIATPTSTARPTAAATNTPTRMPTAAPVDTPAPTRTALPTVVPTATPLGYPLPTRNPSLTPWPTPIEPAQEWTFTDVGQERYLITYGSPRYVLGKVIVAGLQTTIIRLTYLGPFPASVMLVKDGLCDSTYAVELYAITEPEWETFVLVHQPAKLRHEHVDTVVVCAGGETVATTGAFPPPKGY